MHRSYPQASSSFAVAAAEGASSFTAGEGGAAGDGWASGEGGAGVGASCCSVCGFGSWGALSVLEASCCWTIGVGRPGLPSIS